MRVLLISANQEKLPSAAVPLGVLSVAGALRDAHDVRVADLCFEEAPLDAARRAIADFQPEAIGLGIRNLNSNAYDAGDELRAYYRELAAVIRQASRAPLVLGGAGFSLRPAELIAKLEGDHGVVGEGEIAMREVIDALARGERPARFFHAEAVRPPVTLGARPAAATGALDLLPRPARDLADPRYFAFEGTDNVQTKRGCAFQCTYCDYPDLEGRRIRVRDPERVADEMVERSRVPGVSHLFIVDSIFNVPPAHALAVCRALTARRFRLPWVCYATPAAFDDELVAAMAGAGCAGVEIGSDSGTERVLKRLKKPFGLGAIRRARELFLRHGLLDCHTFVLGAEGETLEEATGTLDFVAELDPDVAVFIVFQEDREASPLEAPRDRRAFLELLERRATSRPGWVVPELNIRSGPKLMSPAIRQRMRGPAWLYLANLRRQAKRQSA